MLRIKDKGIEIEKYLEELSRIVPRDFEEYGDDIKTKAACERYFEKIIEAVIDLSFLIVKEKNLKIPESDESVFETISEQLEKDIQEFLDFLGGLNEN